MAATLTRQPQPAGSWPGLLRVSGSLTRAARLVHTQAQPPHLMLLLHFAPAQGLPYRAHVDLGADTGNHLAAEALLPHLHPGAAVSVAAQALQLVPHTEPAELALVQPQAVLLLQGLQAVHATEPDPQLSLMES